MIPRPQLERLTGHSATPYLTRVVWGRLRLHWFHRGDADPDPHDHQWDFATFPLTSYIEEVWSADGEPPLHIVVRAGAWSRRPASWRHRVIGRADGKPGPIVTICITGPKRRAWGFWRRVHPLADILRDGGVNIGVPEERPPLIPYASAAGEGESHRRVQRREVLQERPQADPLGPTALAFQRAGPNQEHGSG